MNDGHEKRPDDAILITDLIPRDDVKGGAASGKLRFGEPQPKELKDLPPAAPSVHEQDHVKGGFTPVPIPIPKIVHGSTP